MRLYVYLFFLLLSGSVAQAQKVVFGNEWINPQQTYYRIPIAQKGLYRLTYSDLQKAGLPVTNLDPQKLQLFHRGTEQAIWVEGESDGKFDATDYVEFLGRGNDGVQDSTLYRPASAQPNPYYSLYSDSTAFFLTTRLDAQGGKRMVRYTDLDAGTGTSALSPEPYVWAEELRYFNDSYPAGNIYPLGAWYGNGAILSPYDVGEGWMGNSIRPKTSYAQAITLTNVLSTTLAQPTLITQLIGRTPAAHTVNVQVGPGGSPRILEPIQSQNYDPYTLTVPLLASDVADGGRVVCALSPQNENDEVSMAYLRAVYPHTLSMAGETYREFRLNPAPGGRALLRLTNVAANTRVYDVTTPGQTSLLSGTLVNGTFSSVVREATIGRKLLLTSVILPVPSVRLVAFRPINPAKASFIIVAHPMARTPIADSPDAVQAYAAYRASKAGGSHDTLTLNIHQVYNQFGYGERSPLAIRRMVDYLTSNGNAKHLLLVGRSRDPQGVRRLANADTLDMIPSGGWPGSDLALVTGLNGKAPYVPALSVGRLNVTRPRQVLDYLNKVKEHEAAPATAAWRKQMLHLSGGKSAYELSLFRAFVDEFGRSITAKYVCANVETVSKQTDDPTEAISVTTQVNRGLGIISMFGHSSLDISDIDIGYVSNDRLGYRNKGLYPLLLANGCASGNFYFGPKTFVTDWVLTPDRGAILGLAHTHNGFASALKTYSDNLYAVMADSLYQAKTFGEIQVEAIGRYMAANTSVFDKAAAEEITLQGDPAVRLFPFAKPDLTFSDKGVAVKTVKDSVMIQAVSINLGRGTGIRPDVRIRQYAANGQLLLETRQRMNASAYADTLRVKLKVARLTDTYFDLFANADSQLDEERVDNNTLQIKSDGQVANLPFDVDNTPPVVEVSFDGRRIQNEAYVAPQPQIQVLVADENTKLLRTDPSGLELYLQRPCAGQPCPFDKLPLSSATASWSAVGGKFALTYRPAQPLPDGAYTLEVYGSDLSGNRAQPYAIRFQVKGESTLSGLAVSPNPLVTSTVLRYTLTGAQAPTAPATLRIFDITGRELRTLSQPVVVGTNEFYWDGTSGDGRLPNGIYLYRLDIPGQVPFADGTKSNLTGRIMVTR
ncbi:hypothetical protein J2I47_09870 [Fibrella sp. HMF5335]|uniref:Gingipain domain-containing protein n=1 Tax=Fibrella rubiginis TaxID=2817060 RepID=A0A939K5V1_9BACT|nr:C25 family cysteine peptidase [Fibrella rubiginis]MBO0936850.1 hypothetical protein [Fibrella rubiginis]